MTMARAKGLSDRRVMNGYAARNAILPPLTAFASFFASAVGGLILVEVVFSYPGVGLTLQQAALGHDYPVVQALAARRLVLRAPRELHHGLRLRPARPAREGVRMTELVAEHGPAGARCGADAPRAGSSAPAPAGMAATAPSQPDVRVRHRAAVGHRLRHPLRAPPHEPGPGQSPLAARGRRRRGRTRWAPPTRATASTSR